MSVFSKEWIITAQRVEVVFVLSVLELIGPTVVPVTCDEQKSCLTKHSADVRFTVELFREQSTMG